MGLFDFFKSKENKKEDVSKVKISVEFTNEELDAINRKLEEWQSVVDEKTPQGHKFCVVPKVMVAMQAQGLFEYALQLVVKSGGDNLSSDEVAAMLDKAIKAQMKAYGLHDLPLYLFHLALIYELAGNLDKAKLWFKNFLSLQSEFVPDKVDELNLAFLEKWQGFDLAEAIKIARGKIEAK